MPFDAGGRGRPAELQEIEQLNEAGKSRQAKARLTKLLAGEAQLPVHVRLHAFAALGRTEAKLARNAAADGAYDRVLKLSQREAEAIKALSPEPLARARYAQGEALFHFAEKERRKVEALKLPQMAGGARDEKALKKLLNTKLKPWLASKRAAVNKAERAYLEIIRIESPPPGWMVAAAARVGDMWLDLSPALLSVPYPKTWDREGFVPGSDPPMLYAELRATYLKAIHSATEPQRQRALGAYKKCVDLAERLAVRSAHTQHCYAQAAKLSANKPR